MEFTAQLILSVRPPFQGPYSDAQSRSRTFFIFTPHVNHFFLEAMRGLAKSSSLLKGDPSFVIEGEEDKLNPNNYLVVHREILPERILNSLVDSSCEFNNVGYPPCFGGALPPAFVPLWSIGGVGRVACLQRHYFFQRPVSFVEVFFDDKDHVEELGTSLDQFLTYQLYQCFENIGEIPTGFYRELSDHLGLYPSSEDFANPELSLEEVLLGQQAFFNPPAAIAGEEYNGSFPTIERLDLLQKNASNYCGFECSQEVLDILTALPDCPAWLNHECDKKLLFDEFSSQGKLKEAWLTLNSNGWIVGEAKARLLSLVSNSGNDSFIQLAEAWLSNDWDSDWQY